MLRFRLPGILILMLASQAISQFDTTYATRYEKYFKVPATYFDYHNDGSTFDFSPTVESRFRASALGSDVNLRGWADSTLTADSLPKRAANITAPYPNLSYNITQLFRPWVPGVIDSFVVVGDTALAIPDVVIKSDSIFKNMVIKDSLRFAYVPGDSLLSGKDSTWIGGGFSNTDPINGKGFGNESENMNSCYSMMMHNTFTYKGEKTLYVGGDDDYYAYINGKLVSSGGGFHMIIVDSVRLDQLGLTVGQKYPIDIFYVNRRYAGGIYLNGITDFSLKSSGVDTLHDTILTPIVIVDGIRRNKGEVQNTILGIPFSPSVAKVKIEAFTVTGQLLLSRRMNVNKAMALKSVTPARSLALIRVTFYDTNGAFLGTGSRHFASRRND